MRKGGKAGFDARNYSSGSMFPEGQGCFTSRPHTSGLRKPPAAPAAGGAFVPPFVKKALAAQNEEPQQGPLSPKTLEMLAGSSQAYLALPWLTLKLHVLVWHPDLKDCVSCLTVNMLGRRTVMVGGN